MSINSRIWSDATQIIGSDDGWVTLSGTTEIYSDAVNMVTVGYEGAHVIIEADFDDSPTDNIDVKVYGSLDGTNFDDTPYAGVRIYNEVDPNQKSIVVAGLAYFRIGMAQTGSTDSHNVRAYYRAWRWQSL